MSQFQQLRVDRDGRGVVTVTIDVVGRPVNVFDESLLREFAALVEELQEDRSARLVVFRSAKPGGFLAGADLHRIAGMATVDEAEKLLSTGQTLFRRVAELTAPTVAVMHGPCLGGGLEFALACTYRVARDDAATRMGLPETQLGLIPGWGGTQLLPRVVGLSQAIEMILEGSRLTADNAKSVGLIDAVFSPAMFEDELAKWVRDCLNGNFPKQESGRLQGETSAGQQQVLAEAHQRIAGRDQWYPALTAALRCIETGVRDGMDAGLAAERAEFCRVLFDPASRNLLELFLRKERARKRSTWVAGDVEAGSPIRKIAVLGAGTMGAGIAQIAAAQGCSVWLMDVSDELVQQGVRRIEAVTQQAVRKHAITPSEATRVLASITPTTQLQALTNADLVIEAVVERLDVKVQVFSELDRLMPARALLASNTSALSISTIAAATRRKDRIAGLHFFNPVHRMPLVEIVRCPETSGQTIAALVDLARQLGKTPIVVAEGPGFLANRVLFPYLNEAVRLIDEGLPAEQIDSEARELGLPMGPLELLDLIGLDVAADIGKTLAPLSLGESPMTHRLTEMVARGLKGQKTGAGFYTYKEGRRSGPSQTTPATTSNTKLPFPRDFAGETISGIQQRLVFSMINAAADCVHDGIVAEPWMADLGMVLGIGFPSFRGGPMTLISQWGRDGVLESLKKFSELCGPRFRPSAYFAGPEIVGS
jgi:3-hydroxyacyl-CoA dehydrogenase / enoyl-CoA hydratase / 3-hydroxybutyryl-CoA epimerase